MIRELERRLKEPFPLKDIEWRIQRNGWSNGKPWAMVLAYVDARAVMDRLDDVFGIDGWEDCYEHRQDGVMCSLTCDFGERLDLDMAYRRRITKHDGSPETQVEAFKGGISKALVRTAVKFGIGRYLYKLESNFAECTTEKRKDWFKHFDKKEGKTVYWRPPALPLWALPAQVDMRDAARVLDDETSREADKEIENGRDDPESENYVINYGALANQKLYNVDPVVLKQTYMKIVEALTKPRKNMDIKRAEELKFAIEIRMSKEGGIDD